MRLQLLTLLAATLLAPCLARAADYAIDLDLTGGNAKQSASTTRPATRPAPAVGTDRPVLSAAANEKFLARWEIRRTGAGTAKDVLVHFFVVRLNRSGAAPPPLDPKQVVIESALTMDFSKDGRATGKLPFKLEEAGVYLVQIEVQPGESNTRPPEPPAAVELIAK